MSLSRRKGYCDEHTHTQKKKSQGCLRSILSNTLRAQRNQRLYKVKIEKKEKPKSNARIMNQDFSSKGESKARAK